MPQEYLWAQATLAVKTQLLKSTLQLLVEFAWLDPHYPGEVKRGGGRELHKYWVNQINCQDLPWILPTEDLICIKKIHISCITWIILDKNPQTPGFYRSVKFKRKQKSEIRWKIFHFAK